MIKRLLTTAVAGCSIAATSLAMNPQVDPDNPNGYIVSQSDVATAEASKTANPAYALWAETIRTLPNAEVEQIVPGRAANPDNVKRAERVFPESEWDFLTQMATKEYTYTRFLRAIGKFPAFCGDYTDGRDADAICKKSLVTAFAHFAQETGGHDANAAIPKWRQALFHVREMGWNEGDPGGYNSECSEDNWQTRKWPCGKNADGSYVSYFGRGAKQLSYHYNYGAFSEAMFGDATVLLNDPGLVADSWLNLASAIFFFVYPQPPKPSMLHVIDRTWSPSQAEIDAGIGYGFGTTINIINGGLECGEQNKTKGQPVNRISYWEDLAAYYNIPIEADEKNTCWQQKSYTQVKPAPQDTLYINYDQDWTYFSDRPGGYSFECQLVGYQTAFSALVPGDYEACVTNKWGTHKNWPAIRVVADSLIPTPTPVPSDSVVPGAPAWNASKVYYKGDLVSFSGAIYEAQWWTKGDKPNAGGAWALQGVAPTATPTAVPTATPTAVPTATPTAVPTATPTAAPTATPTAVPTATPTAVPTATPTAVPTATPTATPAPSCAAGYVDGASYATGAQVSLAGDVYQCSVGGWCSLGGAYAPNGWAGSYAWTKVGVCQ